MTKNEVQFKSAEERQRDEDFCAHYHALGIPAVVGATALARKKQPATSEKESPKK